MSTVPVASPPAPSRPVIQPAVASRSPRAEGGAGGCAALEVSEKDSEAACPPTTLTDDSAGLNPSASTRTVCAPISTSIGPRLGAATPSIVSR